jgi:hypothetical protein
VSVYSIGDRLKTGAEPSTGAAGKYASGGDDGGAAALCGPPAADGGREPGPKILDGFSAAYSARGRPIASERRDKYNLKWRVPGRETRASGPCQRQ